MPKVVDKKEKAKTISDAALKVFRERGYTGTRMADIANEAGIGKGTIYEYFKDKSDILRYTFEAYFKAFTKGALVAMSKDKRPADKLLSLVDFALRHAVEWEDHCTVYVDYFGASRVGEGDRFSLNRIYEEIESMLKILIEEGQAAGEIHEAFNPEVIAEILVSTFDGIILHRILEGKGSNRDLIRIETLRLLTRGLLSGQFQDNKKGGQ
jgi:AcrR family transcriptional regulator